jgi:hypothetical protein
MKRAVAARYVPNFTAFGEAVLELKDGEPTNLKIHVRRIACEVS